jgi:hypothetical protein
MKARFFAVAVVAAGLAGCATDYVPPPPSSEPGPAYTREIQEGRPGIFGDLRWTIDLKTGERIPNPGSPATASVAEQEEFKKWRESAGRSEREEFEEWRAWQEWKRKNPK